MNRSQTLIENIVSLCEHNLFATHGFDIDRHLYLSPKDKDVIVKRRKRIIDTVITKAPRDRRRILNIYKHEDQYIGSIEHQSTEKHPVDIHYYLLKKVN